MKRFVSFLLVLTLVMVNLPAVFSAMTLTPDASSKSGSPGATVTFSVTVDGIPTSASVTNVTATSKNGWNVSVSPASFTGTSARTVTITVSIPSTAQGGTTDTITVTATSYVYIFGEGYSQADTASTTLNVAVVEGNPDVQLSASTTSQNADPSTNIAFTVTLINNGTIAGDYTISATDTNGWNISLSQTSASLNAGTSSGITVTVSVPFVEAGTTDTITVTATESGTGISRSIKLNVTVNAYLNFSLSTTTLSWSGTAGGTTSASITVTVTSNRNFNINVYGTDFTDGSGHTIPIGNFYADKDGNSPYDLTLSTTLQSLYSNYTMGQNVQLPIYFIVNVPAGLPAGTYAGTLYIDVTQS